MGSRLHKQYYQLGYISLYMVAWFVTRGDIVAYYDENMRLPHFLAVGKFWLAQYTGSTLYGCMLSTKGHFMGTFLFLYALSHIFVLFVTYSKHELIYTVYIYKAG
jgi:hypothetical protein